MVPLKAKRPIPEKTIIIMAFLGFDSLLKLFVWGLESIFEVEIIQTKTGRTANWLPLGTFFCVFYELFVEMRRKV